jgi:putative Holliday junction resolvase
VNRAGPVNREGPVNGAGPLTHRLIGLDVGDRRVGVAVSDAAGRSSRPLATFRRVNIEADAGLVARLAAEQGATELVVGLPLEGDGAEGEQAVRTRAWGDAIAERTGLRLAWRDERFTTQAAEAGQPRLRRERATGQPTRAAIQRRRASVDREAAARILQAELNARAARGNATGDAG